MIRHLAPTAPGRLGERLDPAEVQVYIDELQTWVLDRRHELDELDAAALASKQQSSVTSDLTLSMALWKAISDRLRLILATWDGGRVLAQERERLSVLIWGRLDASLDPGALAASGQAGSGAAALAVSLPEACRISDALASQLRVRLSLDPAADEFARRLKGLRAQLERLRDQSTLEPADSRAEVDRTIAGLTIRTDDLAGKVERGGDIGGLIGPLENDAARLERDLIVGGARRREDASLREQAVRLRDELAAKAPALKALASQCAAEVDPCPNYAIPDVEALGPVPDSGSNLTAYRRRLDRVTLAMAKVHEAYAGSLAARDDLLAQLVAAGVKADALGVGSQRAVVDAAKAARGVLERRPAPIAVATTLVAAHQAWIDWWSSQSGQRVSRRHGVLTGEEIA